MILPKPLGQFAVGTTEYYLVDKNRKELHDNKFNDDRELMIQAWYPASTYNLNQVSPYVKKEAIIKLNQDLNKWGNLHNLQDINTHSYKNARVSHNQQKFPVILFAPGFGQISNIYTSIIEDLASNGYIVFGINFTYNSSPVVFPDGRIIEMANEFKDLFAKLYQDPDNTELNKIKDEDKNKEYDYTASDMKFVIDQLMEINKNDPNNILTNKLDLQNIGLLGQSGGAGAATKFCALERRCKAGINLDGQLHDNQKILDKPFMFMVVPNAPFYLTAKQQQEYPRQHVQPIKKLYNEMKVPAYYVEIKGANHMTYSDFPFIFKPNEQFKPVLNPYKGLEIIRRLITAFFDLYLKSNNENLIKKIVKQYSEIMMENK